VQIRDSVLSDADVARLGGPSAQGIPLGDPQPPSPVGLWEFDDSRDLTAATIGNDLSLVGSHSPVAGVTPLDGAVRIGAGSHYRSDHGIAPNGGGSFVNQFTLAVDFKILELGVWHCFYQTNVSNSNDGDGFVRPDGAIGVGATGYGETLLTVDTWYRLVITVDNATGTLDYYLDGDLILEGNPQDVDGRFSLDPTVLFFADENGDDATLDVSMVALYDRALFPDEIIRLGGPGPVDPDNVSPRMIVVQAGPGRNTSSSFMPRTITETKSSSA
jgi:hypothetical protein